MKFFSKIKDSLLDGDYLKDLSKLVSSTLIANLIPILISPVLARMYSPEAFGYFGLYISVVNIATVLFTGRYEMAIVLSKTRQEAVNLIYLALLIGMSLMIIGYMIIVLIYMFSPGISSESYFWVWAVPVSAYMVAVNRTLVNFSSSLRDYGSIALNKIIRASSVGSFKMLAFPLMKASGLIVGNILGFLSTVTSYLVIVIRKKHLILHKISLSSLSATARAHKKFFQFDLISGLLNAISLNIPIIILSLYYTKEIVGHYSMAFTIINLPMMLIGTSIGQIYYERISKLDSPLEISRSTAKVFQQLLLMGSTVMLILIFGDLIFSFVLGKVWRQAGEFAQYMAPWVYLVFIASPISNIYLKFGMQRRLMNFNIVLLLSRVAVLFGAVFLLEDVKLVVLLFSLTGFLIWYVLLLRELKLSKLPVKKFGFQVLIPLIVSVGILGIRYLINSFGFE